MISKEELLTSDQDPLCCCEYINDKGDRSHIFGCCCDCEALDDSFDRLIQRQPQPKGRLCELTSVFLDRLRFPWVNGARRVEMEMDILLPLILVPGLLLLGTLGPLWTFLSLGLTPISVQFLRRSFLSKIPRTKFYFSFVLCGIFYNFLVLEFILIPFMEILHWEYSLNIIFLCLTLYSMYLTKLGSFEDADFASTKAKLPSFYYCRTCSIYIQGRDHHCVWINCCIGSRNKKYFMATLIFASMHLLYNAGLILTTICYPKYLFNRFFLVPYACPDLYLNLENSLCFVCALYGIIVTILLSAILIHQIRMAFRGVSYLEWKYKSLHSNNTANKPVILNPSNSESIQDTHKA